MAKDMFAGWKWMRKSNKERIQGKSYYFCYMACQEVFKKKLAK